jgi:uncharacterized protein (TIGR02231 family)
MRTVRIFAAIALVAMVGGANIAAAQDAPKPVSSRVTAATVFLHGAELTQTARLTLPRGASEISIEGLSPVVASNSIRINIGGGVVVSSHEFSTDFLAEPAAASSRVKMLHDSIAIYTARIDRTDVDLKVNSKAQVLLDSGISKSVSGSEAGLGVDELKKTMDYHRTKSEELLSQAIQLNTKKDELTAALERVTNQYEEESGTAQKSSGVLRLNLSAPAAGTFTATITYFTPRASWSPYYDINAASPARPITFAARSRVSQTTGIDWTNVRLTLSTSLPSNGKVAPLFSTWFLSERVSAASRARGMSTPAAAQNAYSYDVVKNETQIATEYSFDEFSEDFAVEVPSVAEEFAVDDMPSIYDHVTTADNVLNVTYDIDLPYTIPGNGKERNVDLERKEATAGYKFYCAPRLDGATYLLAEIADPETLGLLSAPANITYDGTYIGKTWIDADNTKEKLALTLGTDKRVSVTRELMKQFSSTKSLGGNTEQTFTWRITVRNNQTRPVDMVLKDQYPISTDKSITVALDEKTTTPWSVNKSETGVVTWEDSLAAGEVRTYTFSYTVKYPKDMILNL